MNKKWNYFNLNDVFQICKGQRIVKVNRIKGEVLLKTAGEFNNGFKDKIKSNKILFNKNCLTIDMFGNTFFESNQFHADDNIHVLKNDNLNAYNGLFLVELIKKLNKNYSYSRQIRLGRLKKEKIYLPVDDTGNPDWRFMEEFIKERARNISFAKKINNKEYWLNLEDKSKKIFDLSDLFVITNSGKSVVKKDMLNQGDYNYISTKATSNGLQGKINYFNCGGNVITVDSATIGVSFYQDKNFVGTDHVEVLKPKFSNFNKWIGIYIVSLLNISKSNVYNYSRGRTKERLAKEKLLLPIDEKNNPDWRFMEEFIKERAFNIKF